MLTNRSNSEEEEEEPGDDEEENRAFRVIIRSHLSVGSLKAVKSVHFLGAFLLEPHNCRSTETIPDKSWELDGCSQILLRDEMRCGGGERQLSLTTQNTEIPLAVAFGLLLIRGNVIFYYHYKKLMAE